MGRLRIDDSELTSIVKMSDGNPGAIHALTRIFKNKWEIIPVMHLDDLEVYGSRIWILYKDCCGEDANKVIEVLKLVIGKRVTVDEFNHRLDNSKNFEDLLEQ